MSKRWGWVVIVGALGCLACASNGKEREMPPAKVKLASAQERPVEQSASFIAELNSRRSIALNPQVSGYIKAILVKAGDPVKAGQVLFQIDSARDQALLANLISARAAQQAQLRLSEANAARAKRLAPSGVVSQQELEQSVSALESARAQVAAGDAQVRAQQVQLGYYRIAAPYDGTLGDIPSKVGDFVSPQTPLTLLNQGGALEAYVRVPLALAPRLGPETEVQLLDDAQQVITSGKVDFVSPTVDGPTQSILVKTVITDAKALKTSQFVPVRIIWSRKATLTVPEIAVSRQSGQTFVFVAKAENGRGMVAEQRQVQLGEIVGNDYIVRSGLSAGDQVVVAGTQKVRNGAVLQPE